MKPYPKIDTLYKRHPDTHKIIEGDYSCPEFEMLKNLEWEWTEKIDGTNIRIIFDALSSTYEVQGRTDNASIPIFLLNKIYSIITRDKLKQVFPDPVGKVCLYGEGYGAKIQRGGGNYISDGVDFILFDVLIQDAKYLEHYWWLKSEAVYDIACQLGIKMVPSKGQGTLSEAVETIKARVKSEFGDFLSEGLVLKPYTELRNRRGNRIITKIKHRDFGITTIREDN